MVSEANYESDDLSEVCGNWWSQWRDATGHFHVYIASRSTQIDCP